jgi:hypothetical protein
VVETVEIKNNENKFKFGFYGVIFKSSAFHLSQKDKRNYYSYIGDLGTLGFLCRLSSGLEISLGLGFGRTSEYIDGEERDGTEIHIEAYELIPGVSYELGKGDFVSYGVGFNFHIGSNSVNNITSDSEAYTEPKGWDMAFFPNIYAKAELVKDFAIGLKAGYIVIMPGDKIGDRISAKSSLKDIRTEASIAFYL